MREISFVEVWCRSFVENRSLFLGPPFDGRFREVVKTQNFSFAFFALVLQTIGQSANLLVLHSTHLFSSSSSQLYSAVNVKWTCACHVNHCYGDFVWMTWNFFCATVWLKSSSTRNLSTFGSVVFGKWPNDHLFLTFSENHPKKVVFEAFLHNYRTKWAQNSCRARS